MIGQTASRSVDAPAPSPDEPSPTAAGTGIVILGMHRSGTSSLSHLLVELGCALGGESVPAAPDNPLGYHEHAGIVTAHDDFLRLSGRSWSDPRPFSSADFESPAAAIARCRLERLFAGELRPAPRWVLKDPRMCRLLPLWRDILGVPGGPEVVYLHVTRSPLAVAQSLAARDQIGLEKSLLLWMRHHLEAEAATRERERAWLDWDEFIASPRETFARILQSPALGRALELDRLDSAVQRVLRPSGIHHRDGRLDESATFERFPWVRSVRGALDAFARGDEPAGRAAMDQVTEALGRADALLMSDPRVWESGAQQDRSWRIMKDLEEIRCNPGDSADTVAASYYPALLARSLEINSHLEADWQEASRERDAARSERDALRDYFLNSRSWRITAPIRRVMNALRGKAAPWP